jgi:hypothetical protein
MELGDMPLDPFEPTLGAVEVGDEPADRGAVADPPQPGRERREGE